MQNYKIKIDLKMWNGKVLLGFIWLNAGTRGKAL